MDLSAPRILEFGDRAINVEFGDTVDAWLDAEVLALDAVLRVEAP